MFVEFWISTFKETMEYSDKGQRKVIRNYITDMYIWEKAEKTELFT